MPKRSLERIIRLLKDEEWHDIDEIANRTGLSPIKLQLATEFLAKYGFLQIDRNKARMKISRYMARFFRRISGFDA